MRSVFSAETPSHSLHSQNRAIPLPTTFAPCLHFCASPERLNETRPGKSMRHVKIKPGVALDKASLEALISAAHRDIVARLERAS